MSTVAPLPDGLARMLAPRDPSAPSVVAEDVAWLCAGLCGAVPLLAQAILTPERDEDVGVRAALCAASLDRARARVSRARPDDPVLGRLTRCSAIIDRGRSGIGAEDCYREVVAVTSLIARSDALRACALEEASAAWELCAEAIVAETITAADVYLHVTHALARLTQHGGAAPDVDTLTREAARASLAARASVGVSGYVAAALGLADEPDVRHERAALGTLAEALAAIGATADLETASRAAGPPPAAVAAWRAGRHLPDPTPLLARLAEAIVQAAVAWPSLAGRSSDDITLGVEARARLARIHALDPRVAMYAPLEAVQVYVLLDDAWRAIAQGAAGDVDAQARAVIARAYAVMGDTGHPLRRWCSTTLMRARAAGAPQ